MENVPPRAIASRDNSRTLFASVRPHAIASPLAPPSRRRRHHHPIIRIFRDARARIVLLVVSIRLVPPRPTTERVVVVLVVFIDRSRDDVAVCRVIHVASFVVTRRRGQKGTHSFIRSMAARRALRPLLDRVLVERIVAPTKSVGGVLLPESTASAKVRCMIHHHSSRIDDARVVVRVVVLFVRDD